MKIQINQNETYEILIPDTQVTSQRFFEILSRLNSIGKILGKSVADELLVQPKSTKPKFVKISHKANGLVKILRKDRALFVESLRNYYKLKDKSFVGWFKEKTGFQLSNKNSFFNKSTRKLKEDLKIMPQEVGLEKFPTRGEARSVKFLGGEK